MADDPKKDQPKPHVPEKADAPKPADKGGLVTSRTARGDDPKAADKPEKFTPGPGPDDPSVAYDGGFDRDKDK